MTSNKSLAVEIVKNIAVIRFTRPHQKNPLSVATLEELKRLLSDFESNSHISSIIFTGSGDTFASGANLREIADTTADKAREFALRGQDLMQQVYHSKKQIIAAIDGYCFGGALDLALSCKVRIASLRSEFAHPGVSLGIITGWGGTQLLPRLIGETKALEMFLTARRVDANEALRIGLVDELAANPLNSALSFAEINELS